MKALTASVGNGGSNYRHDVEEVQAAINDNIGKLVPPDFLEVQRYPNGKLKEIRKASGQ